jgi:hypothetical protein
VISVRHMVFRAQKSISPLLVFALLLASFSPLNARSHEQWGAGLTEDLDKPYEQVLSAVKAVTEDGIIRGTYQYKGAAELDGAVPAEDSKAFPKWTEAGTVLYKIRPNTLSPAHFRDSNDQGMVTVRYVVVPLGPRSARIVIHAVFLEQTLRRSHPSDGQVESNEFEAITARLRATDDLSRKREQEEAHRQQQQQIAELEGELDLETAKLNALKTQEAKLQNELGAVQGSGSAQVKTTNADLKSEPYNQAKTLQLLVQGEMVKVLIRTEHWYRVQAVSTTEGWVYRPMLEEVP